MPQSISALHQSLDRLCSLSTKPACSNQPHPWLILPSEICILISEMLRYVRIFVIQTNLKCNPALLFSLSSISAAKTVLYNDLPKPLTSVGLFSAFLTENWSLMAASFFQSHFSFFLLITSTICSLTCGHSTACLLDPILTNPHLSHNFYHCVSNHMFHWLLEHFILHSNRLG